MKLIDKDALVAEMQRLSNEWRLLSSAEAKYRREVYTELLSFINTLEVKEPASEDLSDLIDKLSKRYPEVSFAKLSRIVVAATKWQKSQDQQTIELAEEHAMLAGMTQERERMVKDAIEGWVARDECGDIAIFSDKPHRDLGLGMWISARHAFLFPRKDEYPDVTWNSEPQKVKVIIIKE